MSGAGSIADGVGPWRSSGAPTFPAAAVDATVGERFAEIAERFPDRIAVRSPSVEWTYAELAGEVHRIAGGLTGRLGPRTGQPVAVLAAHDGPLVAAVLGVISAGQVVVILDPAAPVAQTTAVLDEACPRILLHDATHAELATELSTSASRLNAVPLDSLDGDFDGPERLGWSAPLMLAFTSGTSGSPKGAIINHGVLLNLVRGATEALGIDADDTMPMLFPTSLAVAAYPMFLPLLNGGTLATLDVRSVGLAPVADFLADEAITLAYMAPTVVRFLVDALAGREFPALRMIALGGELVDPEILKVTADLFGCEHLAVGYGTTETGVVSLAVFDAHQLPTDEVHCGFAVPEVRIEVVDDAGTVVAPGTAGEVAVTSRFMFDGYWGHPELNRQVLTEVRDRDRPEWRYRTGDLGRVDASGALTLLGRSDTKVKIRGRFVVLGDVESDLHELEPVVDAVTVARSVDGVAELVAYVVPADPSTFVSADLRAQLLERREAFRVPSRWVVLDELPRLPNGKVDRRALPDPDMVSDEQRGHDAVATVAVDRSDLRGQVRSLWERLLPVGRVGDDEDFFELGGDSLLAAQMLVMLEEQTGVTVPMGDLVHARTVRSLAESLARHSGERVGTTSTVSCVQHGDLSARPRLWFVHDLQGSAYRVRHLAAALGADQPVWSFESPLLAGERNHHTSLDTFAARYVTDLLEVQPEGPYWLAGYSFGGICAYEMARQLVRDGHEVAFVGVVDVGPGYRGPGWSSHRSPVRPWFGVAPPPPPGLPVGQQVRHYREMFERSPRGALRHAMVRTGLARVVDPYRFEADLRRDGRVRPDWRLWYAWEQHWQLAARGWDRTSTYSGAIDLFWADESASSDATMGWAPLVDDVRIHRFPGDHLGILEPTGAPVLAESLRLAIDDRRAAS